MADLEIKVAKGRSQTVKIKPTFEGAPVPNQIVFDNDLSDLKNITSVGELVPNSGTGLVSVPITGTNEGTEETKVVFKYTGNDSDVENIGISTKHWSVAVGPEFTVELVQTETELIPAESNRVDFTLVDGDGNPITNATFVSIAIKQNPNKFVIAGYSNRMDNIGGDNGNTYRVYVNGGHTAGSITITVTVSIPDISDSIVLPDIVYNNAGSPLGVTITPDTISPTAQETTALSLVLTQKIYAASSDAASGKVTITDVTGPGTVGNDFTETDTLGTYAGSVVSNGNAGSIVVKGTYLRNNDSLNNVAVPFEFTIAAGLTPGSA